MNDEATKREFETGEIAITPNALENVNPFDVVIALSRHCRCDWGDCSREDAAENAFSLGKHLRIFSVYHDRNGVKFWIITEADRSATTVMLPEDY